MKDAMIGLLCPYKYYTLHYVPRSESFAFPLGFWAKEEMASFFFYFHETTI